MEHLKTLYKQLTNVDIDEQRRIWDERGKGYYGEYLLFCHLYSCVVGNAKILMNLDIPVDGANSTETDLLLIHETGLYVFEIKHYKGTIYGSDTDKVWTQYFRTTKNSVFNNPIEQNGYHIRALRRMFPDIPIRSVVVFTSDECDIRITNSNSEIDVCLLRNIIGVLSYRFSTNPVQLSMEDIDNVFARLMPFSKMQENVVIDNTEAPFGAWIQPTVSALEVKKAEVQEEKNKWTKALEEAKETKKKYFIVFVAALLGCILIASLFIIGFQKKYDNAIQKNREELEEYKQTHLRIDQIDDEYTAEINSYVEVSSVSLTAVSEKAVSFTATLSLSNYNKRVALTEKSKYIVITRSNEVFEYNVFGNHLRYNRSSNVLGKGYRSRGQLATIQFDGISVNDISYIKITEIELLDLDEKATVIEDNLEIELYSN